MDIKNGITLLNKVYLRKEQESKLFLLTVIAQLVNFGTIIGASRYFDVYSLGNYGLYLSVYSLLAVLSTLRLEVGIYHCSNSNLLGLVRATLIICFTIPTVLSGIGLLIVYCSTVDINPVISLLLCSALIAHGISLVLIAVCSRSKAFLYIGCYRLVVSCSFLSILMWMYIKSPTNGLELIVAHTISTLIGTICLIVLSNKYLTLTRDEFTCKNIWGQIKLNKSLIIFELPSHFGKLCMINIPYSIIGWNLDTASVGQYYMSHKMLGAPLGVMSSAITEILRSRIGKIELITYEFVQTKIIQLFSLGSFIVIMAWILSVIVGTVLLPEAYEGLWLLSGILAFGYLSRFVNEGIAYIYQKTGRSREEFRVIGSGAILLTLALYFSSSTSIIGICSIISVATFMTFGVSTYKLSR